LSNQVEALANKHPNDSLYIQLALIDLEEDLSELEDYYITCDPSVLESENKHVAKKREKLIEKSRENKVAIEPGAFKKWEPRSGEMGFHIYDMVKKDAKKVKKELNSTEARNPSSAIDVALPKIRPDPGPAGNITGNAFPKSTWALTFDDGPNKNSTRVLDNLAAHKMKATFFVLSQQIQPELFLATAERERDDAHAVASHSYTHANVPKLGPTGRNKEIVEAAQEFEKLLGKKPLYYRLPYGSGMNVPSVREIISQAGMIHVFWNVDTLDWQDKDPDVIVQRALAQIKQQGHGVILFHDIHSQSVTASEKIMAYLTDPQNGIRTVTLPEIVDEINAAAAVAPPPPPTSTK